MIAPSPIGALIRARLRALDRSQDWLAETMHVSPKHVTHLITGKAAISADMAVRLEQAIGADADWLMCTQARAQVAAARASTTPVEVSA